MTDKPKNTPKQDENQKRQDRLDEALRTNLKKRKQQVRKRAESNPKTDQK